MILIAFKVFILSWLLTHFSPIKMILNTIPINNLKPIYSILMSVISLVFSCIMCCNFWVGLIITHNIYFAATMSFIGYLYSKVEDRIEYEKL